MPEGTFVHPLFGSVRFRTTHSTWMRGDGITFLSGFDTHERFGDGLAFVSLPRLTAIAGVGMDFGNDTKVVKLTRNA